MENGTDADKTTYLMGNFARGLNDQSLLTYSTKIMELLMMPLVTSWLGLGLKSRLCKTLLRCRILVKPLRSPELMKV